MNNYHKKIVQDLACLGLVKDAIELVKVTSVDAKELLVYLSRNYIEILRGGKRKVFLNVVSFN